LKHHKLYIKNMVCHRCKLVVQSELEKLQLHPLSVDLGEVTLQEELKDDQVAAVKEALEKVGFELIDDRKSRLIEKIKNVVINLVHHNSEPAHHKYSEIISGELHYDYPYLSRLFTEVEGITIEQYIIQQKIEKVKEYLVYDELSLSQIAFNMGYSSVAHLSAQFKKITGLTPSQFKALQTKNRKPLDQVGG
jgi:AraC family transcriptional regulator